MPRPAAPRHRASVVPAIVIVLATVLAPPRAAAEPMGALSLSGGIVVRGTTTIEPDALARPLAADDELLRVSRPQGNRKLFLSALARKATLALERAGFSAPKVVASIEPTGEGSGERIVVDVVEGPRSLAAGIEIRGFPDDLTAGLARCLQGQRAPAGAIAVAVESGDGWGGEKFVDDSGRPVRMEPPLWSRGEPAPFDSVRVTEIRAAIARHLREQGYFASAKLLDTKKPAGLLGGLASLAAAARTASASGTAALEVAVKPGAEPGTAVLVVTGTDLPPRSVLRDVVLPAGTRTSKETLTRELGIVIGGPVTERDQAAWRRTLHESGRFVSCDPALEEVAAGADGVPGVVARFALEDYAPATPFGSPPSREEETMLRFRRWIGEALGGGGDLVATWIRGLARGDGRAISEIALSRDHGLLLATLPASVDACGAIVTRDGLSWYLPKGAGRFTIPLPADQRLTAQVALSLSRKPQAAQDAPPEYDRNLSLGLGFESRPGGRSTAFDVGLRVDPVACLAVVHEGRPSIRWEGDTMVVGGRGWTARFDEATGRLVALECADSTLALEARQGRFEADRAALEAAAGDERADPDALVSSALAFFNDDTAATAFDSALVAASIDEYVSPWRERFGLLLGTARRVADSGALAAVDRAVAAAMAENDTDLSDDLEIPAEKPTGDPIMLVGRFAAGQAWRIVERDCGRESWPAGLVRLATLGLAQDPAALEELSAFMTSETAGPIAHLVAASGVPLPLMAVTLARRGTERLSPEAFHADCRPLLAALSAEGLDTPLVALLRSLTDEETASIGRIVGHDDALLVPLVAELKRSGSDAAAVAALPAALDVWWETSLRNVVAAILADKVAPRTAGKPGEPAPVR